MEKLRPVVEEHEEGDASLTLMGTDDRTLPVFEAEGMDGSGYDWGEVGQALVLMKMPDRANEFFFDPEGDYLLVCAPSRPLMNEFANWLQAAIQDPKLLLEAIRFAEEHGLTGCS